MPSSRKIGTAGGTGYVIEYAGDAVRALSMEGRMTLVQHDDRGGRARRPDRAGRNDIRLCRGPSARAEGGQRSKRPCMYWRTLKSDADAKFDAEIVLDAADDRADGDMGHIAGAGVAGDGASCPIPQAIADEATRAGIERALALYGSESPARR